MVRTNPWPRRFAAPIAFGYLTVALTSPSAMAQGRATIPWRFDLERARAEARALDRPLWVQFTASWCHACERMDRETFADPRVVRQAVEAFLPVKLRSDLYESLALSYGLSALPATVIVQPSGAVIATREGFTDATRFRAFLEETLVRSGRPHTARQSAEATGDTLALAGYCPVSLVVERRLIRGQAGVSLIHDGREYRFANRRGLELFQSQPERYAPVNGGYCPVSQVEKGESRKGDPRWGTLYEGHLYLCADDASRQSFLKNPERYASVDVADRGFCPHCWGRDQLLIRGRPDVSLTLAGRRYLFPGTDHRDAFQSARETSRR